MAWLQASLGSQSFPNFRAWRSDHVVQASLVSCQSGRYELVVPCADYTQCCRYPVVDVAFNCAKPCSVCCEGAHAAKAPRIGTSPTFRPHTALGLGRRTLRSHSQGRYRSVFALSECDPSLISRTMADPYPNLTATHTLRRVFTILQPERCKCMQSVRQHLPRIPEWQRKFAPTM